MHSAHRLVMAADMARSEMLRRKLVKQHNRILSVDLVVVRRKNLDWIQEFNKAPSMEEGKVERNHISLDLL